MAASLPPAPLPPPHSHTSFAGFKVEKLGSGGVKLGGVKLGGHSAGKESISSQEPEKKSERDKMWGITPSGGREGGRGTAQAKRGEKKGEIDAQTTDPAVRDGNSISADARDQGESKVMQSKDQTAVNDEEVQEDSSVSHSPANKQTATSYQDAVCNPVPASDSSAENDKEGPSRGSRSRAAAAASPHSNSSNAGSGLSSGAKQEAKSGDAGAREQQTEGGGPSEKGSEKGLEKIAEGESDAASSDQALVLHSPCSTEPSRENSDNKMMDVDPSSEQNAREEWQQNAGKRKAEELGLDEDALMVAQILTGALGSVASRKSHKTKDSTRAKSSSTNSPKNLPGRGSSAADLKKEEVEANTPPSSQPLPKVNGQPRGPGTGHRRHSTLDSYANVPVPGWARLVIDFLEVNGQELLHAICAHYRIDFLGDVSQIREYSLEQIAHNALFNPALPKASGRLPKMLRDMEGVSDFKMTFVKEGSGIYRNVRVTARLKGTPLAVECRACSYCGSCFSGRFMKPNAMHQQAGGWKEITERTQAGKFSWESLRGWRLCVPCFTHWASNGTNVNANRPSIDDLLGGDQHDLNYEIVTSEHLPTGKAEVQHLQLQNSQAHLALSSSSSAAPSFRNGNRNGSDKAAASPPPPQPAAAAAGKESADKAADDKWGS